MGRRVSPAIIFTIVWVAVLVVVNVILPMFFKGFRSYGSYFPLFFFFPFIFGRGFRNRNQNNGNARGNNTPQDPENDIASGQYDSKGWQDKNQSSFDEYGIRTKSAPERYWYYVGAAVIVVIAIVLLFYRTL